MIVIDVGCKGYENADSVGYLVERFHPSTLYGFDPNQPVEVKDVQGTHCVLSDRAGWTHDGYVTFYRDEDWAASRVWDSLDEDSPEDIRPCVDIAGLIQKFGDEEIVLKLDCEGAEYPILERLRDTGLDSKLTLALVEWHSERRVEVACPVEEWVM